MAKSLTILSFILLAASLSHGQSSPLKLGYVEDPESECGCSLARNRADERNRRLVFLSSTDEAGYINLNGKRLKLKLVGASKEKRTISVGDRAWKTYSGAGLRVRIDFIVSSVCAPNDEACEVTNYNATMTVRRRAQKTVVKTIGLCGC